MEGLVKQMRVRFSGIGQDSQDESTSARRTPVQKTQSFKTDKKKKGQNWLLSQFSGMGRSSESSSDGEYETAIAAATYAIMTALEEEDALKKEKLSKPDRISRPFTGDETSKKKPEKMEKKPSEVHNANQKKPEKVTSTVPSKSKFLSFAPDVTGRTPSGRTESTSQRPNYSSFGTLAAREESETPRNFKPNGRFEAEASAWEKAEMAKIKKRYEKQSEAIQSWENEKTTRARRRFDRKEKDLELRRAMASQECREEIERINNIAAGARSLAEERKRNEESRTRQKAKKIRSTGKVPITWCCC